VFVQDQDFASQDQDLFVMYTKVKHFSFSAVNENADENEIPFMGENVDENENGHSFSAEKRK